MATKKVSKNTGFYKAGEQKYPKSQRNRITDRYVPDFKDNRKKAVKIATKGLVNRYVPEWQVRIKSR